MLNPVFPYHLAGLGLMSSFPLEGKSRDRGIESTYLFNISHILILLLSLYFGQENMHSKIGLGLYQDNLRVHVFSWYRPLAEIVGDFNIKRQHKNNNVEPSVSIPPGRFWAHVQLPIGR